MENSGMITESKGLRKVSSPPSDRIPWELHARRSATIQHFRDLETQLTDHPPE